MDAAVVVAQRAKLAERPGGRTIATLRDGAEVTVLGGPASWVEVEAQGYRGVVSRRALRPVSEPALAQDSTEAPVSMPPPANPSDITVSGNKVLGPGGIRFGTLHKLGLYNYGATSLKMFFAQDPVAFPSLPGSVLRVMQAVSDNEGKIEAINTWDNAILSCSLYQWTTAAGTAGGELPYALGFLKQDTPAAFASYFGSLGLDVQVQPGATTGYFLLDGQRLDTGDEKAELRKHIWAYRFWRAAHEVSVRRAYVKAAIARIGHFYHRGIAQLGNWPLSAFVSSEVGVAQVLDQHVNRPGHVPKTLVTAIQRFASSGGSADPGGWKDADERRVIALYLEERTKTSMTHSAKRAEAIAAHVTSGALSDKRGSFSG
ncbi:hypothetical protein [Bosea sp. LjRoot237]|uniref:hypothetical protein n=1 Tax=Bosea sp. LjRoot237 TaxID=3342292 RepID=UPI003ECEFA74